MKVIVFMKQVIKYWCQTCSMFQPLATEFPSIDLMVTSNMAESAGSVTHDPANFVVRLPNSLNITKVVKCVPKMVTVPRMFNNIDATNNTFWVGYNAEWLPGGIAKIVVPPMMYSIEGLVENINRQLTGYGFTANELQFEITSDGLIVPGPNAYNAGAIYLVSRSPYIGRALGWTLLKENHSPTVVFGPTTLLSYVLPITNSGVIFPQLGGVQCVNVTLGCVGPQMINAKDSCPYDTLAVVPMNCSVGETAFFQTQDLFVHDIDHPTPRAYSTLVVRLLDAWTGMPLTLPNHCTVSCLLKLFHVDTRRDG
jgi:hypothetical protein